MFSGMDYALPSRRYASADIYIFHLYISFILSITDVIHLQISSTFVSVCFLALSNNLSTMSLGYSVTYMTKRCISLVDVWSSPADRAECICLDLHKSQILGVSQHG